MRGTEMAGVVRVMTIHKSKGLGFDVVLLPDLEGQRLDQRRAGLAVERSPERTVDWVLELPPKLFYEQDAVLDAHVRRAEAEACYEAFALLYVAMTRARDTLLVSSIVPHRDAPDSWWRRLSAHGLPALDAPASAPVPGLPGGADLVDGGVQAAGVAAVEPDLGAVRRQCSGHRQAQATACAGDQGHAALEREEGGGIHARIIGGHHARRSACIRR